MEFNHRYCVLLTFLTLFCSSSFFAQIVIGDEKEEKGKIVETAKKKSRETADDHSFLYMQTHWAKSYRVLQENDNVFGQALGERANEVARSVNGFGIGVRTNIKGRFDFVAGLGYLIYGEEYKYEEPDTNFMYTTSYRYVSIPLGLEYRLGKDLRLVAGFGLIPGMFINNTQDQTWKTKKNLSGKNQEKFDVNKDDLNPFSLSTYFRIGAEIQYSERFSLYVIPEYRRQLTSTYTTQSAYVQYPFSLGATIGLSYKF